MDTGTKHVKNHWFITLHSIDRTIPAITEGRLVVVCHRRRHFLLINIYRKLCNQFRDKPSTQPVKILPGNALMSPSI